MRVSNFLASWIGFEGGFLVGSLGSGFSQKLLMKSYNCCLQLISFFFYFYPYPYTLFFSWSLLSLSFLLSLNLNTFLDVCSEINFIDSSLLHALEVQTFGIGMSREHLSLIPLRAARERFLIMFNYNLSLLIIMERE